MSWIIIIWSMIAGTCVAMACLYFIVWFRARASWVEFFFVLSALAAAAVALFEQALMHAQSAAQYGEVLRWMHIPAAVVTISLVWFFHLYLKSKRLWLVWLICSVRVLAVAVNFVQEPNLNFQEITGLRQLLFWGEMFSILVGVMSPWAYLTRINNLLFLIFVVDASIGVWRKGGRRRAAMMGGTFFIGIVLAAVFSALMNRGVLPGPFISIVYMLVVLVMAFELSNEALRARLLSRELYQNQQRMNQATATAGLGLWEWDMVRDEIWLNAVSRARLRVRETERLDFNRLTKSL